MANHFDEDSRDRTTSTLHKSTAAKKPISKQISFRLFRLPTILIVVAATYLASLGGGFLLEDELLLNSQKEFASADYPLQFFTEAFVRESSGEDVGSYRPLYSTLLWLQYNLWGRSSVPYHMTSVLLHVLSTMLLFYLMQSLLGKARKDLSLCIALLWGVLPIHTEAICYTSASPQLLMTPFYLGALIAYAHARHWFQHLLFVILSFAALFCSELALSLPLAAAIFDLRLRQEYNKDAKDWRRSWRTALPLGLLFAMLISRLWTSSQFNKIQFDLPLLGGTFWNYFKLFLSPFQYSIERSHDIERSWLSIVNSMVIVCILGVGFHWLRRVKNPLDKRLVGFLAAWAICAYIPISNLFPTHRLCADQLLYLPSIAACACIMLLIQGKGLKLQSNATALLVIGFFACLATTSSTRTQFFNSSKSVYNISLETSPNSPALHQHMGNWQLAHGNTVEAEGHYRAAIDIDPMFMPAFYNLGILLGQSSRFDEADKVMSTYVLTKDNFAGWHQLGRLAMLYDDSIRAKNCFLMAQIHKAEDPDNMYFLAIAHQKLGNLKKAKAVALAAVQAHAHDQRFHNLLITFK